jgi:hypothetical protein
MRRVVEVSNGNNCRIMISGRDGSRRVSKKGGEKERPLLGLRGFLWPLEVGGVVLALSECTDTAWVGVGQGKMRRPRAIIICSRWGDYRITMPFCLNIGSSTLLVVRGIEKV